MRRCWFRPVTRPTAFCCTGFQRLGAVTCRTSVLPHRTLLEFLSYETGFSLLEPSKKIDPKFATWIAQTKDGKVHSGLLISRDEQSIVIRNAKAEDTILNANDVEELQPQAISLMPEKQLNDLRDADIASLLEFLSQQKSWPAP